MSDSELEELRSRANAVLEEMVARSPAMLRRAGIGTDDVEEIVAKFSGLQVWATTVASAAEIVRVLKTLEVPLELLRKSDPS